mgnify:CR=1 FL=1|tara:strand:- start:198 stop:671 length:474 start_codon:yes stop_codon:yes gene_type:complete
MEMNGKPTTWNEGVELALEELDSHTQMWTPIVPPETTMTQIEWAVNEGKVKPDSYVPVFIECANYIKTLMPESDVLDMPTLLLSRQMKYGKGNIATFKYVGIAVRLHDKLSRLMNSDEEFMDESVADTKMDIVGYTVIAIMLKNRWWELPVQTSMFK